MSDFIKTVNKLRTAIIGVLLCVSPLSMRALASEPVIGATFGPVSVNKATIGDIWTSTWAADGAIYVVQDDSMLPDGSTASLAVSRLDGDDPRNLSYTPINKMEEYFKSDQASADKQGSWKGSGIISLDNTLYLSINRVRFASLDGMTRQIETVNASIIKSTDGGKTWTRSFEENLEHPMFPGSRFSNPVFIQYGRNASATADGSDRYIYAVSSNGPWSHADYLILGRVLRSKIGNLNGRDWEFYRGAGRDGMLSSQWTRDASGATPILSDSDNLGWTNVAYIPQSGRYLMGQWHWLKGRWHEGDCTWILREAPTPWGPWTIVTAKVWDMYHDYYFPVFAPKFISEDGLHLNVFTAGSGKYLSRIYRLNVIPLDLWTQRSLATSDSHLEFRQVLGQEPAKPQSIDIQLGNGHLATGLRVEASPRWLKASVDTTENRTRVVNEVTSTGLAPGEYTGQVTIVSPAAEPVSTQYTVLLKVQQPREGLKLDKTRPGILYQYYAAPKVDVGDTFDGASDGAGHFWRVGRLSAGPPQKTGVCTVPGLRGFGEGDKEFFAHFEGYFIAQYPGEYTFFVNSQDGSRLTVADELVVDNDGFHAPYERSGAIWLGTGAHRLAVDYFQGAGQGLLPIEAAGQGLLRIDVRVPGQARRPLEEADVAHIE